MRFRSVRTVTRARFDGIRASKNRSGCPRSDDRHRGQPPGPLNFNRHVFQRGVTASTVLKIFAKSKTMWTLPSLWTHRTRPQGLGKPHRTRFPTAPTSLIVFVEGKKTTDRTLWRQRASHTKFQTLPTISASLGDLPKKPAAISPPPPGSTRQFLLRS
jgi:hypothetical protein